MEGTNTSSGGSSAAATVSSAISLNPSATVPVKDLPRVLSECVKALQQQRERGARFVFLSTVTAALAADGNVSASSAPSVARSPGRASSSSSSSSSSNSSASAAGGSAVAGASTAPEGGGASSGPSATTPAIPGGGKGQQKVRFGTIEAKHPHNATSNTGGAAVGGVGSEGTDGGSGSGSSSGTVVSKGPPERLVQLVILEPGGAVGGGGGMQSGGGGGHGGGNKDRDWVQHNNPKERKQALVKKKELEFVPGRVRALLSAYASFSFGGGGGGGDSSAAAVTVTPVLRSAGAAYSPGMVLAVDVPFGLLRRLSTILMTRLHSAMASSAAREDFDALDTSASANSSSGGGGSSGGGSAASKAGDGGGSVFAAAAAVNLRKALKQIVAQLCGYAKQLVSTAGTGGGAGSVGATAGVAGKHFTGAGGHSDKSWGSQPPSPLLLQLYLYSVGDDQLDMVCCDARALLGAKLIS